MHGHGERLSLTVILSGAILGFTLFGDSLIYSVLPVHAENLGIPLVWVGVILSINRWIRLATNPMAVKVYGKIGIHRTIFSACALAVATTVLYAFPVGIFLFLVARILWGLCWSHLRLGAYLVVFHTARKKLGLALGSMRAVSRLGSAFALLAGGALVDNLGYSGGLVSMGFLSAFSIPLAFFLRERYFVFIAFKQPLNIPFMFEHYKKCYDKGYDQVFNVFKPATDIDYKLGN